MQPLLRVQSYRTAVYTYCIAVLLKVSGLVDEPGQEMWRALIWARSALHDDSVQLRRNCCVLWVLHHVGVLPVEGEGERRLAVGVLEEIGGRASASRY